MRDLFVLPTSISDVAPSEHSVSCAGKERFPPKTAAPHTELYYSTSTLHVNNKRQVYPFLSNNSSFIEHLIACAPCPSQNVFDGHESIHTRLPFPDALYMANYSTQLRHAESRTDLTLTGTTNALRHPTCERPTVMHATDKHSLTASHPMNYRHIPLLPYPTSTSGPARLDSLYCGSSRPHIKSAQAPLQQAVGYIIMSGSRMSSCPARDRTLSRTDTSPLENRVSWVTAVPPSSLSRPCYPATYAPSLRHS